MREVNSSKELAELLEKEENLVIDFYADWCAPCQIMQRILSRVERKVEGVTFVKVNVDKSEIADLLNVESIPTILVLGKDKSKWLVGVQDEQSLLEIIREVTEH